MKQSHFFAHLSRLKLINRWPLMRNVLTENVSEHSLQVAMVAHALAAIKNRKFGGNVNAERIALLAMYHDASEVLTGDLHTSIRKSLRSTRLLKKSLSKNWSIWFRKSCGISLRR